MSHTSKKKATLAWTGERMIPGLADSATEMFHYQRYLYFRPWYAGRKVIDAASGEGYGANYASVFAEWARGFDISQEAIEYGKQRYPHVQFEQADVCKAAYQSADLVMSFETIEHLPDPVAFLEKLNECPGAIVISTPNRDTHSPGNRLTDKPFNPHHTIEWTPSEFAELIESVFFKRRIRFLSQAMAWPGTISEGLQQDAMYTIAVIDGWELPSWPRLGISIPTRKAERAIQATTSLSKVYPGPIHFALVANGCSKEDLHRLDTVSKDLPGLFSVIVNAENEGYGAGANKGLDYLWQEGWYDYFGVANDDIHPATDCLCEMVNAFLELEAAGQRPGIIGPVSNQVNGLQKVDIGTYSDIPSLLERSEKYHRTHVNSVTEAIQIRGLFFLMSADCFNEVGGFDPRFGIGNFEDDDLNIRARLAGFSLWMAQGAFLHHEGSTTFKELGIDYGSNIDRNLSLLLEKYGAKDFGSLMTSPKMPLDGELLQPLTKEARSSGFTCKINGETVDLIHQATPIEFAIWLGRQLEDLPRDARERLIHALKNRAVA